MPPAVSVTRWSRGSGGLGASRISEGFGVVGFGTWGWFAASSHASSSARMLALSSSLSVDVSVRVVAQAVSAAMASASRSARRTFMPPNVAGRALRQRQQSGLRRPRIPDPFGRGRCDTPPDRHVDRSCDAARASA